MPLTLPGCLMSTLVSDIHRIFGDYYRDPRVVTVVESWRSCYLTSWAPERRKDQPKVMATLTSSGWVVKASVYRSSGMRREISRPSQSGSALARASAAAL